MKRILVLLVCLCFIFTGCTPKQPDDGLKEFKTPYGLSFRLPEDAEEIDDLDYPLFISNLNKIQTLPDQEYADKAYYIGVNAFSFDGLYLNGYGINNLQEFAKMLHNRAYQPSDLEKFQDGYVFTYPSVEEFNKVLCLQGEKCYYWIVFSCEDSSEAARQQLENYLSKVKVVKVENEDFLFPQVGVNEFKGRIPLEFSLYDSTGDYTEYRFGETKLQMGVFNRSEFSPYPNNSHEAAVYLLNVDESQETVVDRGDYSYLEIKADYGYALIAYWRGENDIYALQFSDYDPVDNQKTRDMVLGWFDTFKIGQ